MDEKKVRIWIEFVLHFEFTVFSSILFFVNVEIELLNGGDMG